MAKQVTIKSNEVPDGWSEESADFINRVITFNFSLFFNKFSAYKENLLTD
jgi:hypothetical protein